MNEIYITIEYDATDMDIIEESLKKTVIEFFNDVPEHPCFSVRSKTFSGKYKYKLEFYSRINNIKGGDLGDLLKLNLLKYIKGNKKSTIELYHIKVRIIDNNKGKVYKFKKEIF